MLNTILQSLEMMNSSLRINAMITPVIRKTHMSMENLLQKKSNLTIAKKLKSLQSPN